ncbi:MAG: methyltransferase domain-containing protein [Caulobacteraceae bacterium]|nr:methyltransferase domain-containing protein [Caulobacteraceae bacterium]
MTTPGTDVQNTLTNLELYACPQCRSAFTYRADEEIGDRPRGGNTESRDRFFNGTGWPERMEGETILEAGCGSGRFTEIMLGTGARVISFDYSVAADVTNDSFAKNGATVSQASIYEMPFQPESFDRVFCYGVIQHTPDVKKSFFNLVSMVKPGGEIAVDVYDAWKWIFHSRYRVRWFTKHMNQEKLLDWCRKIVPAYMKVMPPLHPYNQIFFPVKDYRGARAGLHRRAAGRVQHPRYVRHAGAAIRSAEEPGHDAALGERGWADRRAHSSRRQWS